MTSEWIQGLIIAAAVAWSVLHLARKYFPRQVAYVRAGLAARMEHAPFAPVRRLGTRWRSAAASADNGCDSGCGSCSGCASNPTSRSALPDADTHPLTFHRHR